MSVAFSPHPERLNAKVQIESYLALLIPVYSLAYEYFHAAIHPQRLWH